MNISSTRLNRTYHRPQQRATKQKTLSQDECTQAQGERGELALLTLGATAGAGLAGWGATALVGSATATALSGGALGAVAGGVTGLVLGVAGSKDAEGALLITGIGAGLGATAGVLSGYFGGQPAVAAIAAVIGGAIGGSLVLGDLG